MRSKLFSSPLIGDGLSSSPILTSNFLGSNDPAEINEKNWESLKVETNGIIFIEVIKKKLELQ